MKNTNRNAATRKAILAAAPEAYWVAGVGWCGPKWEEAARVEASLTAGPRDEYFEAQDRELATRARETRERSAARKRFGGSYGS